MIPMVIKDKVAAAMYVDALEPNKLNQNALELLVFATGLLIDTMPFRKKVPSPSLSRDEADVTMLTEEPFADVTVALSAEPPARPAAPPPRAAAVPPRPAPSPAAPLRPTPPPPTPPRGAPPPPAQSRSARQYEIDSEASASRRPAAPPESFATTAIPAMTQAPAPQPSRPAAPPAGSVEVGERSSTQYIPPAGVRGGARFAGGPQSDEVKKHDEAKRFARLLISEIKLYNESKVDQGRKHKDIYERLKDDIDRSRQMYDERVPDSVRKSSNYFYDELVRILADGDADALGL